MISQKVHSNWVANLRSFAHQGGRVPFLQAGTTKGTRYSPLGILARTVDRRKRTWNAFQSRYGDKFYGDYNVQRLLGGFLSKQVTRKLHSMGRRGVPFFIVADWVELNVPVKSGG